MADWLANYDTRKKLTVDHTLIDSDLFDFPSDVILRSTNFDFTKSLANGFDVRFTAADGTTLLDFERERHDNVALKAEYKTRLPFISSAAPTDSFVYYKNDPSIPDGQNPTAVWDTATKARWSLKEDPTGGAGAIKDSTINNNDGTSFGAMTSADSVEGQVGRALDFDGVNDYVEVGVDASLNFIGAITLEAWVYRIGSGINWSYIVGTNRGNWNSGYALKGELDDQWSFFMANEPTSTSIQITTTAILPANEWVHIVATWDGVAPVTAEGMQMYFNDVIQSVTRLGVGATPTGNNNPVFIGSYDAMTTWFNGLIDEVRISNIACSPAWRKATYHSGNNTLLTYGTEELKDIQYCLFNTNIQEDINRYCFFNVSIQEDISKYCFFNTNIREDINKYCLFNVNIVSLETSWLSFNADIESFHWEWYSFSVDIKESTMEYCFLNTNVEETQFLYTSFNISEVTDSSNITHTDIQLIVEDFFNPYIRFKTNIEDKTTSYVSFNVHIHSEKDRWFVFSPSIIQEKQKNYLSFKALIESFDELHVGFKTTPQEILNKYLQFQTTIESTDKNYLNFSCIIKPEISFIPKGGNFTEPIKINIRTTGFPQKLRITLNGIIPNENSTEYSGEDISILKPITVWVKGWWEDGFIYDKKEIYNIPINYFILYKDDEEIVVIDEEVLWKQ